MNKIISFGLWGDSECYNYGALENVIIAKELFPEWKCYIYHNLTCIPKIIDELKKHSNVVLICIPNYDILSFNMFWRFSPAFDKNNIVIVRDTDSRLNIKDKLAVDEFLKSDKHFHIMRDHKLHANYIMGGMWGCKNDILVPFKSKYIDYLNKGKKYSSLGQDQYWLEKVIYPHIVNNSLIHASYHAVEKDSKPFPENNYKGFIGKVIYTAPKTCKIFNEPEDKILKRNRNSR